MTRKGAVESSIERMVREELERLKVPFEQEKKVRIGRRRWSYYIDFAVGSIAIEVDGDYYHASAVQRGIDRRKDERLTKLGYQVVRLTETEILQDVKKAVGRALR